MNNNFQVVEQPETEMEGIRRALAQIFDAISNFSGVMQMMLEHNRLHLHAHAADGKILCRLVESEFGTRGLVYEGGLNFLPRPRDHVSIDTDEGKKMFVVLSVIHESDDRRPVLIIERTEDASALEFAT